MSDQPGGEENEPVESEYEPAPPPAPMAYDQALAAARQAGSTPAESVRAVETSGAVESAETESSDVKPAPEPVISPAAAAAATALPTDGPATPAPAAEDQLAPADEPAEAMPSEATQGPEPVTSPAAASPAPPGKPGMPTPPAEDRAEPAGDRGESAEDQASPAHEQPPPGDEQAEPAEDQALPGDEQAPSVATLRIAAAVERDNAVPAAHTEAGLVTEPVVDRSGNVLGVMYKPAPSQGVEHGSDHPPRPIYYYVEDEPPAKTGRRRRALIIVLVSLLALSACTVGGAWWLSERFASQVHRIPRVFDIPEQERPDKPQEGAAAKALNFLLAGTDRRSDLATTGDDAAAPIWVAGAQRSDTIILVHLSADRKKAYVISFPRDSWVDIPDHGLDKINAAFSLGGPTLYVRTMEHVTGIRIDHLAIIDWDGFIGLTNALGGVDVTIPETTHDSHNNRTWEAGTYHLYGADALDYVRQRYGLPRGDFDRVQRQQNFLREVMRETLNSGTLSNPLRLARVLDAVTRTVSVDDTMSNADLRGLALSLRDIRQGNVVFMTAPTMGTGYEGSASVVYLDQDRARRLFDAVRRDDVDSYLAKYGRPDEQLGSAPAA